MKTISFTIPVHNEEGNLETLYQELKKVISELKNFDHELIFIDDFSHDNSLKKLKQLHQKDQKVKIIELSKNFGHQIALTAGLHHASGDIIIMMDADLQHPPSLIPKLIAAYEKGHEIVYTKRQNSKDIGFFKKLSSKLFYSLFNKISENKIIPNSADFRLISKKVLKAFKHFSEKQLFLRGIFPSMGFSNTIIEFQAENRLSGKSSYTLKKMLHFSTVGITSFSGKPLRIPLYLGGLASIAALIYAIFIIIAFTKGEVIPGWSSAILSILFLSSIQLIFLGIIGEYLYVMFNEIKNRPLYFIQNKYGFDKDRD